MDGGRPVEQVALRELGNAMVSLFGAFAGVEEEELIKEIHALFGGRRLTGVVSQRLRSAVALAEE